MVEEQLFPCKRPVLGAACASVLVDEEGLAVVHHSLDDQLVIPREQITAVVLNPQTADRQVVLRRPPRRLDLTTTLLAESNVLIVFDPPLSLPPLRSGAEKALGITCRERKLGLDVDAIGVTVDDPVGLASAVASLRVRTELTTTAAFVALVGQAFGLEAATVRANERRTTRRRLVTSLLFAPLFTLALAGRLALGDAQWGLHHFAAVATAAMAWGAVIAILVALGLAHRVGDTRPAMVRSPRTAVAIAAAPVAMVLIPLMLRGWIHGHLEIPPTVITGLAAGLPAGAWSGWLLHRLGRNSAT